nr:MAG TPA: protein of unknown function (DUF4387) [Caudoviricetes sp.]
MESGSAWIPRTTVSPGFHFFHPARPRGARDVHGRQQCAPSTGAV